MNYIVQIKNFEEIQNGDHDRIIKIVEKEWKYNNKKTLKITWKKTWKTWKRMGKNGKIILKSSNRKGK